MPPNDQPAARPQPVTEDVRANNTNYAAAVFFTLLIIGLTFHLPLLMYIPVIFFCLVAGIIFFRDVMAEKRSPRLTGAQAAAASPAPAVAKKRNPFLTALIIVFSILGFLVICYVGLIILAVIALGSSGV